MEKRLSTALLIVTILFITMFFIQDTQVEQLKNKIAKQELEMEEKQNMINSYAKKHLKDDGKILIACENQLGLDKLCVYSDMQYNLTKNKQGGLIGCAKIRKAFRIHVRGYSPCP